MQNDCESISDASYIQYFLSDGFAESMAADNYETMIGFFEGASIDEEVYKNCWNYTPEDSDITSVQSGVNWYDANLEYDTTGL